MNLLYNPNDPSVVASKHLSEMFSGTSEEIIAKVKNACSDTHTAVNEKIEELFRSIQAWIDQQINIPGLNELIDYLLRQLEDFLKGLSDNLSDYCDSLAEDVLPWLMSPRIFREASQKWADVSSSATTMSNHFKNTGEASKDADHNWSGVGAEQYTTTSDRQAECAEAIRSAINEVVGMLIDVAQGIEGQVLAIGGIVVGLVAAIVTLVIGLATGPGEAAAIVIAIIELIAGVITAIIGIVEAVLNLAHEAEDKVEKIRTTTQDMKMLASGGREYWHEPGGAVGGGGVAPGTTSWDDGF